MDLTSSATEMAAMEAADNSSRGYPTSTSRQGHQSRRTLKMPVKAFLERRREAQERKQQKRMMQQQQQGEGNTMNSNVNDYHFAETSDGSGISSSLSYNVSELPQRLHEANDTTNVKPIVAALLGSLTTGGTTYAFSVYSSELKSSLQLSQSELDTISASFFCAGLFSWMPGMISDKFGSKCGMILGSISMMCSLMVYYWVATSFHTRISHSIIVPLLSILGVWIFLSCAAVTGAVFKLISVNCDPRTGNKGIVVGIAKGYVGLGSGAYECLFESFKHLMIQYGATTVSNLNFLPMAAFFGIVAACIPALCLLDARTGGGKILMLTQAQQQVQDVLRSWHFRIVYGGLIGLGIIVVGTSLMSLEQNSESYHNNKHNLTNDETETSHHTSDDIEQRRQRWLGVNENEMIEPTTPSLTSSPIEVISSTVATLWMRRLLEENDSDSSSASSSIFENVVIAMMILLFWFAPILSLLCLVDRKYRPHFGQQALLQDDDDDDNNSDNNNERNNNNEGDIEEISFETSKTKTDVTTADGSSSSNGVAESAVAVPASSSSDDNHDGYQNEGGNARQPTPLQAAEEDTNDDMQALTDDRSDNERQEQEQQQTNINLRLNEMLQTTPAWLMLYTCTILAGGGTMMTNNLGQMAESLGFPSSTAPASLALFSAAQATGRVVTGALSERAYQSTWKLSRPFFLVLASTATLLSHLVLALAKSETWFVGGVTLSGFAFGMIWPLMVLIVGECFGTQHMGANYMFYDGATSALGTLLLSKYVTQSVYERHIEQHGSSDQDKNDEALVLSDEKELTCYGQACFAESHWMVVLLSMTCIGTSLLMWKLTKPLYSSQGRITVPSPPQSSTSERRLQLV